MQRLPMEGPRPTTPTGQAELPTRWDLFVRRSRHPVILELRRGAWSGSVSKLIGAIAHRCEHGSPPTDQEEESYLRGVMNQMLRELAMRGDIRSFDAFRDLFVTLLAYPWPILCDEVSAIEPASDLPALRALHLRFSHLLGNREFDAALQLCSPAFAELSTAQGLTVDVPATLHRKILARMAGLPHFQTRCIANEVIRVAPVYDGLRVRLVDDAGRHALSVQALVGNPPRLHVHDWGAVYGKVRGSWMVVAFD